MSHPTAGRSLELYYIDGRPDGMLTAEMFNWTGHVLMAPRTQLAELERYAAQLAVVARHANEGTLGCFLHVETERATVVITDSGGIQEETTYLGVPCLTVRENTERPITVSMGTNVLVGRDREKLRVELGRVLSGDAKKGSVPPLWDGRTGERIADIVMGQPLGV